MSILSLFRQLYGSSEFLLAVEGIPDAWATCRSLAWNFGTPPASDPQDPTNWTIVGGVLQREDLVSSQSVSLDTCELRASDMTFRLVDGERSTDRYVVSKRMSREGAAIGTHLSATLSAVAVASMQVDSSAAFPASGDWFCGLETGDYASKADGTHLTTLTRGKYGSRARAHTYALPGAIATVADYGQRPPVTDRPISWYGRRCWLYMAEVRGDGTLGTAEIVWRGRITGELTATAEMEWEIPAESLVSALSTELLGSQPSTVVQGIYLNDDTTIDWELTEEIGAVNVGTGTFTVDAGTYRIGDLLDHITDRLNLSLDAAALSDDRWQLFEENGRIMGQKTRIDAAPCFIELYSLADNVAEQEQVDPVALILGIARGSQGRLGNGELFHPGTPLVLSSIIEDGAGNVYVRDICAAAEAVYIAGTANPFWVPVESVTGFAAYRDEDEAEGWMTQSVVTLDGTPFLLVDVNATDRLIQLDIFTDHVEAASAWQIQYIGGTPIEVRQGLWMRGDLPLIWRDAVLDNANVPVSMTVGADSRDFDWDDLENQFPGGNISRRDRLLTGKTSMAELIVEDFSYAGLVPVLGLNGLITARPIHNTSLVRDDGEALLAMDADTIGEGVRPEVSRTPERVVNQYTVHIVREQGRPGTPNGTAFDLEAIVNDLDSQEAHRMVRAVERDFSGALSSNRGDIVADVYGVASTIFALLSRETDILPVGPCNGLAYGVLPMDTVLVTHWLPPDPTNSGRRGLASLPALVLGVEYDWGACQISMDLQLLVDNGQRSGFAPEARVIAYTDHGPGSEPRRYELSLDTGHYCSADVEEGTFFLAGFKVSVRQWDVDTISVAAVDGTVTDVDPDAVFVDVAMSAGMQTEIAAGRSMLSLDRYDTASQAALALLYLHVADDTDNLIGATSVTGFHPS